MSDAGDSQITLQGVEVIIESRGGNSESINRQRDANGLCLFCLKLALNIAKYQTVIELVLMLKMSREIGLNEEVGKMDFRRSKASMGLSRNSRSLEQKENVKNGIKEK